MKILVLMTLILSSPLAAQAQATKAAAPLLDIKQLDRDRVL